MERRKFIAGLGSLTAVGAAGIGTGAFSSVTADRTVNVGVTGDAGAYLGLATPNSDVGYAPTNDVGSFTKGTNDDIIKFRLSKSNGTVSGDGVNPAALTNIYGLIGVQNQGTQPVDFYIEKTNTGIGTDTDRVGVFAGKNTNTGGPAHIAESNEISGKSGSIVLDTGENAVISLQVDTQAEANSNSVTKAVAGGDFTQDGPIDSDSQEMLETITFHANENGQSE